MKLKILVAAMVAGGLVAGAWAKGPAPKNDFSAFKKEMAQAKAEAAPAATNDVGDADSFGKNVKYMGLMSTGVINLADDCTPDPSFPPGPEDHCFVVNAQPALTTFTVPDAARMVIPGKSSEDIFCHAQTPVAITQLRNNSGVVMPSARIIVTPSYTFQNKVLNDPALIDPNTGLPFNGQFTVSLAGIRHQQTLQPTESLVARDSNTRACIGGLVSKRALIESYGLSADLAEKFFKKDTLVTMSLNGTAQGVEFSSIIYGLRWYGD
ncbi:MAG: hypothetical protein ABI588_07600 [Arenimonas sp.]